MNRLIPHFVLVAIVLSQTTLLWASATIDSVATNATHLEVNVPTPVIVTAVITDPGYLQGSANLQRRGTNGTWTVLGTLQNIGGGQYRIARTFTEPAGGTLHLRVSAGFRGMFKRVLSPELLLPMGVIVQPSNTQQAINGPAGSGLMLRIPPNGLTEPAFLGIAPALASDFPAPTGNLPVIATLNLIVRSLEGSAGDSQLLTKPLQLSVPAPTGTASGDRFYVAQPLFTGTEHKLLATDTATVVGERIVTQSTNLGGTFGGGPTVILKETGSGYAEGAPGILRPGVFVTNTTNNFAFLTDGGGHFKLPISGPLGATTFTVTAIDSITCYQVTSGPLLIPSGGETVGGINMNGGTPTTFDPSTIPRSGFRNGGFETSANCFFINGSADISNVIQGNGTTQPVEGQSFYAGHCQFGLLCGFNQTLRVPLGVSLFTFSYNSNSSEPGFFVVRGGGGGRGTDNTYFTDGDSSTWQEGTFDLSGFAGQLVNLEFFPFFPIASDVLLLDNVRFGTVLVDVKIVEGAMADLPDNFTRFERVRQQVRDTNDILAQAGLNVRVRNIQTIPDPGNLLETDMTAVAIDPVSGKPEVPSEVAQLLALSRSGGSTDVNVYYVGALKNGTNTTSTYGLAVGSDDYHLSDPIIQRGLIIRDLLGADLALSPTERLDRFREVLAHELGHLLIHGVIAEDNLGLEHTADSGNVMSGNRCTPPPPVPNPLTPSAPCSARAIMNPAQSAVINQNGSGLIVP